MNQRRSGERGMSISMAVLAMTMVAMIMLYVGTQTLNSIYTARKKSDRSVGMAAGDSGIEKYRAALQIGLADETNNFVLDEAALKRLVNGQTNVTVESNERTSKPAGMADVNASIPRAARFTVVEKGTDTIGYWQLYHVIPPLYYESAGRPATDLVVYIRAWATGAAGGAITTKPRIFRVEYRPGLFSDYQSVTDAPFWAKNGGGVSTNFRVDGPIHSNGYSYLTWLNTFPDNSSGTGIYFEAPPTCSGRAKFSTSQGAQIDVPGATCRTALTKSRKTARQLSLLGVEDVFAKMSTRCSSGTNPIVQCVNGGGPYDMWLGYQSVRVQGPGVSRTFNLIGRAGGDSRTLALLVDGEVRLRGKLTMAPGVAGRLTIAARRRTATDRRPQVTLLGTSGGVVGAADPRHTSVGLVTQGDIVLSSTRGSCLTSVNMAAIAEAGSVTVSPEYVTVAPPAVDLNRVRCSNPFRLFGSFSGHGQTIPSMGWRLLDGTEYSMGYTSASFSYNPNLFLNPPPFFPIATPWGVTEVKDANDRCLAGTSAGDPRCE
ncbi:MAG: hypothetical protein JWM86_1745 [Thermoleophilia bacterium]|nr:hypothetical protein [Thermoleophilia bacterium]